MWFKSLTYSFQRGSFIPRRGWDKELGFERTKSDRCWGRIGLRGGREGRDGLQFGESSSSLPRGGSLLHQIAVQHPTPCLVTQGWCPWQHFYTNNAGQPFTSWPPKFLVRYLWKKLIFVCLCGAYKASTSRADGLGRNPERKGLYGKAADAALTSTQLQIRNLERV